MRRLYLFMSLLMATAWLLWSACERDDFRNELPLRPLDGGRAEQTDLPVDLARPNDLGQTAQDMPAQVDGTSLSDMAAPSDAGTKTDGGIVSDGGMSDGAVAG